MAPMLARSPTVRGRRPSSVLLATLTLGFIALGAATPEDPEDLFEAAAEGISEDDVALLMAEFCSPYLEGRDSPSDGLAYAGKRIADRFEAFGLQHAPGKSDYFHTYTRNLPAPDPERCALAVSGADAPSSFELGVDFVPLASAAGVAEGELVWCGYGIDVRGFDELRTLKLRGKIAIFAEGEPRHPRVLDGPALTPAANVYRKLQRLDESGVDGALIVRRDPPADVPRPEGWPEKQPMGFRSSWAFWNGERPDSVMESPIPAVEISEAVARQLLGDAYDERLATIDSKGKPAGPIELDVDVRFESAVERGPVELRNVIAAIPGRDPELAEEWVVIGAHYDHIGVDRRGRVGTGADDNASGTSAMLEMAQAFAESPTRRSLLFCAFSSEEDGLLGSQALVSDMADGALIGIERIAAMVNLDMVGRGDPKRLNAIGADRSRDLDRLVKDAKRLTKTGLSKIVTDEGSDLWQRSDHYPFADVGVPALFLFEETPISNNEDYHTWRDTLEAIELEKIARAARFGANLVWLIAEDDDRPSFGQR